MSKLSAREGGVHSCAMCRRGLSLRLAPSLGVEVHAGARRGVCRLH
ncbi:hypothetical protein HAT2_00271 [Candidatus Similichlamydia laticola]|uniref:Uncharacterized protein n=1 Tax=Candidatus Similichlamydia laticola TaxID=2170265 RepID=A0A369KG25_9BACT|nr:hypothetical protein HAT2_00266 [Candidatus Similichlamydia laticola]RDB31660.1 hypothetical protein HAT2_00271 [Candidatus Similichlamydia laticola]